MISLPTPPRILRSFGFASYAQDLYNYLVSLSSAGASNASGPTFTYQPGGTPRGNLYSDPWQLGSAVLALGTNAQVAIDCSHQSPAPWPVNLFLPNRALSAAPVLAPAVLGLQNGTNPFTGGPSEGKLWFPRSLDGVGVVNVDSTADCMVSVGQIFGQQFSMLNNAYIQRASDADLLGLFIVGNPVFTFRVDNCQAPFQNIGNPASTSNVLFLGATGLGNPIMLPGAPSAPGKTLAMLLTNGGSSFSMTSFSSRAGSVWNLSYDSTIPQSGFSQAAWTGTATAAQTATSGSVAFGPVGGAFAGPQPADTQTALNRVAAAVAGLLGHPIP